VCVERLDDRVCGGGRHVVLHDERVALHETRVRSEPTHALDAAGARAELVEEQVGEQATWDDQ
jgi:hypothetical protein